MGSLNARARGRAARRLRLRLAVSLALVAGAMAALTGGAAFVVVREAFEGALLEDVESRVEAVDLERDLLASRLEAALLALERGLRTADARLLGELLVDEATVAGTADRLRRQAGIDLLWILDAEGRVVSSSHWPEQVGLEDDSLARLPDDRVVPGRARDPRGGRPAWLLRHPFRLGERGLALVGGRYLDGGFLDRIARGQAALFVTGEAAEPLLGGRGGQIAPGPLRRAPAGPIDLSGTEGTSWSARVLRLEDAGGVLLGRIVVAVNRDSLETALSRVRSRTLLAGLVAMVVAGLAGLWIARSATRPLDRLVRAVDAIAAGEADYTFPRKTADELEELEETVSSLRRSMDLHRRRSRAAERVAAWREVARRVAHEVKNPLAPIRLTVENLKRARERDPRLFDEMFDEGARTILEEVDQLKRLVGEFSEFARLPPPSPRRTDLHGLVEGVLELYSSEPHLVVERRYDREVREVMLDPDQISRALKNVVGNAVEAMREGERRLIVETALEGRMVRVTIEDSGPGFTAEVAEGMFRPYFTTKSEGTGLGLAITERIVAEHGGVIAAENRERGGGRVVIRLPLTGDGFKAGREASG